MKKAAKWNGKKSPTTSRKTNGSGSNGAASSLTKEALELLRQDFSIHCRRLRLNMGLTQAQFGKLLGYGDGNAYVAVSRLERGEHRPQREFLEKFIQVQNKFDNQVQR